MPMTVETALVTKKALNAEYNTDSVNASGKTWSRETVHSEKGIKAVGTGKDVPYYVLASSDSMGTAESAADLFKSCTDIFAQDMTNCSEVISEFYVSFAKVLNEAGFGSDDCDISVFCGYGSSVYIAKCGSSKLFRYSENGFSEVIPQMFDFADGRSSYGVGIFNNADPGEIFIMISGNVASVLPEDLLSAICKSANGDIKKLVSIISAQAEKFGCKGAVSSIVIKITEVDSAQNVPAFVPAEDYAETENDMSPPDEIQNQEIVAVNTEEDVVPDAAEETTENEPKSEKGSKIGFGIVLGVFVALVIILAVLAVRGINKRHEADVTLPDIVMDETTVEESTSETESETSEETTVEETTTEETTTEVPMETTTETVATEPTTQRQTDTPSTQAPEEENTTVPDTTEDPVTEEVTEPQSQENETTETAEPPTEEINEEPSEQVSDSEDEPSSTGDVFDINSGT